MRVLQINAVNGIGSTGRTCVEFTQSVKLSGNECFTAYSLGAQTENSKCVSPVWECKYHAFMSRLTGLQGYFSAVSTRNIIKLIKDFDPDIVHLRNLHANYVNLKPLLKYLAKNDIPTVITLHDCWFFTGKCMHYTQTGCYKWQTGCNNCPKLKTDNVSWFFDRTEKIWNDKRALLTAIPRLGVIGVSDWITNESKQSFLKDAKVIERVYNWIDTEKFKPSGADEARNKYNLNGKFVILGVASIWGNSKGLNKFIELSERLNEDEIIVIVGGLPADFNLPKNIIHIPATDSVDELVSLYSSADVFLQLSKEETFGKVTVEALACGTPVITNDCTANPELVNPDCGIITDTDDTGLLLNAVGDVRARGKQSFSKNCRQFVTDNFAKSRLTEQTLDLYKRVIGVEGGGAEW